MLTALRVAVGRWGGRRLLDGVVVVRLYRRVSDIGRRLERMLLRFAAGQRMRRAARLHDAPLQDAVGDMAVRAGATRAVRAVLWPRPFGWLCGVAGHEAVAIGLHLRLILDHPDMVALLVASPQARRLLSPLCRALGVETACLRPVGAERDERGPSAGVKAPRSRPVSRQAPPGKAGIPLPRGILSAARRRRRWHGGSNDA